MKDIVEWIMDGGYYVIAYVVVIAFLIFCVGYSRGTKIKCPDLEVHVWQGS